eukprot:1159319-Pelagomonas_calceolata.AAC.7
MQAQSFSCCSGCCFWKGSSQGHLSMPPRLKGSPQLLAVVLQPFGNLGSNPGTCSPCGAAEASRAPEKSDKHRRNSLTHGFALCKSRSKWQTLSTLKARALVSSNVQHLPVSKEGVPRSASVQQAKGAYLLSISI